MRYSFSLLLIFLFTLIAIIGIGLLFAISSYFYQSNIDKAINEYTVILKIISNGISGPPWVVKAPTYSIFGTRILQGTLESPGVEFIRVVNPETKTVDMSSDIEEIGIEFDSLPLFERSVNIQESIFKGKQIKEFTLKSKDGRGVWMGVSFEEIQKSILLTSIGLGLNILVVLGIVGILIFLGFQQLIMIPFRLLINGFERLKSKDYKVHLGKSSVVEIQKVFQSFNEMAKDLGTSHTALEESKAVLEVKVKARTKELKELTQNLDERVKQRTKEIQRKIEELERFHRLTVGREEKMIELKREIEKLKKELKAKK